MKNFMLIIILASVPVLLTARVLQAYRYAVALETAEGYEILQKKLLEENKKLLASVAVFSAPERVYKVGTEELGLEPPEPANVLHVRFDNVNEADE